MRKIYLGGSGIHGRGIFAKKDIKQGEVVFIFKGRLYKLNLVTKKEAMSNPNMIGIKKDVWLDPVLSYGRYINHSCNPNTGIKGKVTFVALRNINKDEEITFDYSISEDSLWEMPCMCGAKNCRKIIRGIRFLPEKTFEGYMPFIPNYFQKVYKKHKQIQ